MTLILSASSPPAHADPYVTTEPKAMKAALKHSLCRLSHVEKIIISKGLRRAFHPEGQCGRQDLTKDILPPEHTAKAIHLKKALDRKTGP